MEKKKFTAKTPRAQRLQFRKVQNQALYALQFLPDMSFWLGSTSDFF
jgi:hypothetical protein